MILMSAMTTVLFLGGWLPPFGISALAFVPGIIWFAVKTAAVMFFFLWARATLPRFRYDQLMRLGWKVFLPLTLIWVVFTAGVLIAFDALPNKPAQAADVVKEPTPIEKAIEKVEDVVEEAVEGVGEILGPKRPEGGEPENGELKERVE